VPHGRWYCSLCCEVERDDRPPSDAGTIGVDAGVRHLAVLSTGEQIANPRALGRVRRLHARARNIRRDAMHKLTSRLAAEHSKIVVDRSNRVGQLVGGDRPPTLQAAGDRPLVRHLDRP